MLWMAGMGVLLVVGLGRTVAATQRSGPQPVCTNCGSVLFGQWWSKSKGVYECRVCDHDTAGRMTDAAPTEP